MKYLFDIGHPAEFHCFKNTIRNLIQKDHAVIITARDKDVTMHLLEKFGVEYYSTGENLPSKLGKIYSLFRNDYRIFKIIKSFKPDMVINFFSPFAAQAAKLLRKPVIGFHDTEKAGISVKLALPFTDVIVVPECYKRQLPAGKVVKFKGVFELAYLHPEYFTPDPGVLKTLNLKEGGKFVLLRFVSHSALHDTGHKGMSLDMKLKTVTEFRKSAKVFISSEVELPRALKKYEIEIAPEKMHDVLFYASLIYGESATMASESAVLGTPAVFIDDKGRGYTDELEQKYGMVFNFSDNPAGQEKALVKGIELLQAGNMEQHWQEKRAALLSDYIDVTAFMTRFIENFHR